MNKFESVANSLRKNIMEGKYDTEGKLPAEEQLCSSYAVSRQTIRRSLKLLTDEGLIHSVQGSGTYIQKNNMAASSHEIALILRSDEEYTYPSLIFSIKKILSPKGYRIVVYTTGGNYVKERSVLKELTQKPVRAIIAEAYKNAFVTPNADQYNDLLHRGCGILFIGKSYPNLPHIPYVDRDSYYGGYEAARSLIGKGHKEIAAILSYDTMHGKEMYHGIITSQCENGCDCDDEMISRYGFRDLVSLEKDREHSFPNKLSTTFLNRCTAVICDNDEIAYWLIKHLTAKGINIPSDISIVSFDNSFLASYSDIRLTSFALSDGEPAHSICNMLLKIISGHKTTSLSLLYRYIPGSSDAAVSYSSLPLRYSRGVTP